MALQLPQDWMFRCTLMWPISVLGQMVRLEFANDTARVGLFQVALSSGVACAVLGTTSRGQIGRFGGPFHPANRQNLTFKVQTHLWAHPWTACT